MKTLFMFSGQGSHYYQMGRELFEADVTFRRWMLHMDEIVHGHIGRSVLATLYDPALTKSHSFDRLLLTHPAIFMVEFALAQTLIARGLAPEATLGVSMGAFAAAAVAGYITPEQTLSALAAHARAIEEHCPRGGMIAVLAEPASVCDAGLLEHCEIAAENFSSGFVVSALHERLGAVESYLGKRGVAFQRLAISYPFHSRWMESARPLLQAATTGLTFRPSRIGVACCAQGGWLQGMPENYFWTVARARIRFARTIEHLEREGSHWYIDVGPAGSLAAFLKYVLPGSSPSRSSPILSPYGGDLHNLEQLLSRFSRTRI